MTKYTEMTDVELARLCAKRVMGGEVRDNLTTVRAGLFVAGKFVEGTRWWDPCNDANHERLVVKEMQRRFGDSEGFVIQIEITSDNVSCEILDYYTSLGYAEAPTPGRAVVIAALEAVEAE
jgi:hypothetical protein